jgi:hypothetical protein
MGKANIRLPEGGLFNIALLHDLARAAKAIARFLVGPELVDTTDKLIGHRPCRQRRAFDRAQP